MFGVLLNVPEKSLEWNRTTIYIPKPKKEKKKQKGIRKENKCKSLATI